MRKGKTYNEIWGKERADRIKAKIGEGLKKAYMEGRR